MNLFESSNGATLVSLRTPPSPTLSQNPLRAPCSSLSNAGIHRRHEATAASPPVRIIGSQIWPMSRRKQKGQQRCSWERFESIAIGAPLRALYFYFFWPRPSARSRALPAGGERKGVRELIPRLDTVARGSKATEGHGEKVRSVKCEL